MKNWKSLILLLVLLLAVLAGCTTEEPVATGDGSGISTEEYSFTNSEEALAEPDAGIVIDGILDEDVYKDNNWLYLNNDDGGNNVNIAMTSHYGEKGMYFVFDVTESVPIYVNLDRASFMNSCIEMYLAPSDVTSMQSDNAFEIDLLPTGDMMFKRSNGKNGFTNVATTNDIMARLGATTKGGDVNTDSCYGYCMELFIPWDYLKWLDTDVEAMKNGFVYVNPAHITSYNFTGTNTETDRLWYFYAQQNGAAFSNVTRYFRFNGQGVLDTVPVTLQQGENCAISGGTNVIPGMMTQVTLTPDEGYAITSIIVNGEEQIQNVSFDQNGNVTLKVLGTNDGVQVSAKATAVTEGKKTLSGKVILNNVNKDTLEGIELSYIGPKGEKLLEIDADGNFILSDLDQGYYVLKAEKEGYKAINRGILLNQDFYTELVMEYDYFKVTNGTGWILDEQNNGILYKREGEGQVLSNASYSCFTVRANLKFDPELATMGTTDSYTQQRTGIQIKFSNGKSWHIDMLKEKGKYILQYAKISGSKSVTNWKTIYTLPAPQVEQYTSDEGIQLTIMRHGNYAAIWLDRSLIKVEVLDKQYNNCMAQIGFESWADNQELLEVPFSIVETPTVDVKGSPFLTHAKTWNISGQYAGYVTKTGTKGDYTWLSSVINSNDVTTIARDLTPDNKDYSFSYIFKFSNNQLFAVRLHHTDKDGVYRIQTTNKSTVAQGWKTGYALTEEQAAKIKGDGISYRVQILGTTAYVYLDGEEVCTYDLSTVASTGKPSGIENATAKVSFALDGNYGRTFKIPFTMVDNRKDVTVNVFDVTNGTITADKYSCKLGDTVTLTVSGDPGYYYTELLVNGNPIDPNWDGTYSFVANENRYTVTGVFAPGSFQENSASSWNILKQNKGILKLNSHATGNSGWLNAAMDANEISTTVKDTAPAAKDFSMNYYFTFSNGETLQLRLHHTDSDGKYRIQTMDGSTVYSAWKRVYTLSADEEAKVQTSGIAFRVTIDGTNADIYLDNTKVGTIDISKVISTGADSGVADAAVRIKLRMDGNLNQDMEIPYKLIDTSKQVIVNIGELSNGVITTDKTDYLLGDTVTLTVTPDAGYNLKSLVVKKNDQIVDLGKIDLAGGQYSFVADANVYTVEAEFAKPIFKVTKGAWDLSNQYNGTITITKQADGTTVTTEANNYGEVSVIIRDAAPTRNDDGTLKQGNFSMQISLIFANGKQYQVRLHNTDKDGNYKLQTMGGTNNLPDTKWKWQADLTTAQKEKLLGESGVSFGVTLVGSSVELWVDGTKMKTIDLGADYDGGAAQVQLCLNGNAGVQNIEIPYVLAKHDPRPNVTLNIADVTNGTVTTDKATYKVGDTVTLNVTPAEGYNLKNLVVKKNDQIVDLGKIDLAGGQYSFVTEDIAYTVEAEFAKPIFKVSKGAWDLSNQYNGTITITKQADGTAVITEANNYAGASVIVREATPSKNADGTLKQGNFSMQISLIFANGKQYQVRLHNTDKDGNYKLQTMGGTNNLPDTKWKWQADLTAAQKEKLLGESGVSFGVALVGSSVELWVDGTKMKTIDLGANYDGGAAQVQLCMNGNTGIQNIEIPYELVIHDPRPNVTLNIADVTNGTVTTDKANYKVGDTVTLTVTPDAGYNLKSLVVKQNDQILDLGEIDLAGGKYSFVTEDVAYTVEAEFAKPIFKVTKGAWDLSNQYNGTITITKQADGTTVITEANNYGEVSVTVREATPSKNADGTLKQGNFSMQISLIFANGKQYQVRLHNTDKDGNYKLQTMGGTNNLPDTKWKWQADLTAAQKEKLLGESGVSFGVKLVGSEVELWVDGTKMKTIDLGANYDGGAAQIQLCMNGNTGIQNIEIPFTLADFVPVANATVTIADFANGTVTADKAKYKVGDTVTLTVTPAEGYSQKLYINEQPLLLDWKTSTYSFVATEEIYNITGSFVPSLNFGTSDKWDTANQAHGTLTTRYTSGDSGWFGIDGEFASISVKAKNYLPGDDGNGVDGFAVNLIFKLNNKNYSFRIVKENGKYYCQRSGIAKPEGGSDWTKKELDAAAVAAILSDGVDFKLERTDAYTLTVSVNGVVYDTYTMAGVTAEHKVTKAYIGHYGNLNEYITIPFAVEKQVGNVVIPVSLAITASENGTVTADKESYKAGDIVTLTVTPAEGYHLKSLTVQNEGQPVSVGSIAITGGQYSFEVESGLYTVNAEFAKPIFTITKGEWDLSNQYQGTITILNKTTDGTTVTTTGKQYTEASVTVRDQKPTFNSSGNGDFAMQISFIFANGKQYQVRVHNTDKDGNYKLQTMGGTNNLPDTKWKWQADLTAAQKEKLLGESGVTFTVKIVGTNAELWVDGQLMKTVALGDNYDGSAAQIQLCMNGNKTGTNIVIPFTLK